MSIKKITLATISYIVLSMAIAFPWHMIWFHELYQNIGAVTRPEPIIPLGMLAMLIQGVVIAYLYPFWYRGGNPVFQGIKFNFIVGLLVYSVMGFATVAKRISTLFPRFSFITRYFNSSSFLSQVLRWG
ncbi:MAG: DUF1761 domain-containing protein [Verrucomicrobia bacterium]|nr:DUF1761 domain-containing protein [Verrucomicrobiota bacterium]